MIFLIALVVLGCSSDELVPPGDTMAGLGDPLVPTAGNAGYDVIEYLWSFNVDPESGSIDAVAITRAIGTDSAPQFIIDYSGPDPTRVSVDDVETTFEMKSGKLVVDIEVEPEVELTVEVRYEGIPRPHQPPGFPGPLGLIRGSDLLYSVAVLPGDTATWVPINDTPLDPAQFKVSFDTPEGYSSVASGAKMAGQRWTVSVPATEFGFAVGRFVSQRLDSLDEPLIKATGLEGKELPVTELQEARGIVVHHESFLGPFPFPTLGLTIIPGAPGGNSTPGQIFLSNVDRVTVSHEIAHQWIGGSVGTASTRDSWLREGLCEYLAYAWIADQQDANDLETAMAGLHSQLGGSTRPLLDVVNMEDRSDEATYLRGALAIHALRVGLGDVAFRDGLKAFLAAYTGESANTEDFIATMQEHTDINVDELLGPWIDEETVPPLP
jgi:aminopeptidase N